LYDAEEARKYQFDEHYFNVAPKIVIEVDVKIELEDTNALEYLTEKNKTLFDFGVERVVWIFTEDKKIVLAEPNKDWVVQNWSNDFDLLKGHAINLEKLIEKKGYKI
jgi:Uma2 family endonuclease